LNWLINLGRCFIKSYTHVYVSRRQTHRPQRLGQLCTTRMDLPIKSRQLNSAHLIHPSQPAGIMFNAAMWTIKRSIETIHTGSWLSATRSFPSLLQEKLLKLCAFIKKTAAKGNLREQTTAHTTTRPITYSFSNNSLQKEKCH